MSKHTFNKDEAIEIANRLYEEHYNKYASKIHNVRKYNIVTAKKSIMEVNCWVVIYEYMSEA